MLFGCREETNIHSFDRLNPHDMESSHDVDPKDEDEDFYAPPTCVMCHRLKDEKEDEQILCESCERSVPYVVTEMAKEFRENNQWGRLRYVTCDAENHKDLYLSIPRLRPTDILWLRHAQQRHCKWKVVCDAQRHPFLLDVMKLLERGYNILLMDPDCAANHVRWLRHGKFSLIGWMADDGGTYSVMLCMASILYNWRYGIPAFWMRIPSPDTWSVWTMDDVFYESNAQLWGQTFSFQGTRVGIFETAHAAQRYAHFLRARALFQYDSEREDAEYEQRKGLVPRSTQYFYKHCKVPIFRVGQRTRFSAAEHDRTSYRAIEQILRPPQEGGELEWCMNAYVPSDKKQAMKRVGDFLVPRASDEHALQCEMDYTIRVFQDNLDAHWTPGENQVIDESNKGAGAVYVQEAGALDVVAFLIPCALEERTLDNVNVTYEFDEGGNELFERIGKQVRTKRRKQDPVS